MRKITKALLPVLSVSLVAMAGCGSDSKVSVPPRGDTSYLTFQPGTSPRFDPAASDLPFNNDLIFLTPAAAQGDNFDGTADVGAPTDPVRAAVNSLDGFSTSAHFDVLVQGSLDPSTVIAGVNVFLVELNSDGDALDPGNIDMGNPIAGLAEFDVQVVSLDGGTNNVVRIVPTEPLAPKTKYLVFLSNALSPILDDDGEAITRSWAYNALASSGFNPTGALANVQQLINAWHSLAGGFLQFASGGAVSAEAGAASVTVSYTFTTTDPQTPLLAMAAPRAALLQQLTAMGVEPSTALTMIGQLQANGLLPTPVPRDLDVAAATGIDMGTLSGGALASDVGTLYTGYIKLPYYQQAADQSESFDPSFLQENWRPDLTLAGALGVTVPADVDGSFNVTYRYPFAGATTVESVPLQITLPNPNTPFGPVTCGDVRDADGYPVALYVHGITSDRASVLALAHTLASQCVATVAIDLPVHGIPANSSFVGALNVENAAMVPYGTLYGADAPRERHFNVVQNTATGQPAPMNFDTPGAGDGSGAWFINLGQLQNSRDNLRQAVTDLLNLNASMGAISALDVDGNGALDLDRIYVVGVSLGGIVGTVFTTVNQMAIGADSQATLTPNLNPLKGLVVSAGGSQVTQILINSDTFAPVINAGLAAAGVNVGTTNYERFMFAAQSTIDSGDPVSFARSLAALPAPLAVPTLIQQINGDAVVPNAPANAPLAGTEGLATLTGAVQIGPGATSVEQAIVKMTAGGHSSLLRPEGGAPQVTQELQTQVVTFILNGGEVTVGAAAAGDVEVP
ncbi:MAG: hypothetical protein C0462_13640 [Alcanivorax sp.]|nr:hypothetical protein [Alcanivorax sp.]